MNNELYLRRRQKFYVAPGQNQPSPATLATLLKNIESLGYTLSLEAQERVSSLSLEQMEAFYPHFVEALRSLVGAHVRWKPLYPNFPRQVMEMGQVELYLNAIYHYLTNKRLPFRKSNRPELDATTEEKLKRKQKLKVIELGTLEEFASIFGEVVGAKTSISASDKEDALWFITHYKDDIIPMMPSEIPSRETLAILGAALLQQTTVGRPWLRSKVTTATDVLRLAVAMHGGDVSLASKVEERKQARAQMERWNAWMEEHAQHAEYMKSVLENLRQSQEAKAQADRFGKFSRPDRKFLLELLEACPNATEDMLRWQDRWVHLGEKLHPGEWAKRYPKTFVAFLVVRGNQKFATFNSGVETSLRDKDQAKSLSFLRTRPGDFARRLDHVLRLYPEDASAIVDSFASVAEKVSTPVLLQLLTHFKHRHLPHDLRIFFPKGEVAKVWGQTETLPPLDKSLCQEIHSRVATTLTARFAELPPLGACYLDKELKNYLVPFSQRSASKSLRTLGRGSRLALPEANTIRFFLWWKNGRERTDLDLSAAIYDANFVYKDDISYYNLKNYGGHHSGDIVDAPKGAAEFIDLNCSKMKEMGARYVVMCVNSYTEQSYCDLPECFTGWMAREKPGSGEIFEPKTVQDRIDLSTNTSICLPLVIDLETKTVVWMDLALRQNPDWNNVANNLKGVSLMLRAMVHLEKTTLYDLFSLHISGRGYLVKTKAEAQQVFSMDEGVTPFDLDVIASQWL